MVYLLPSIISLILEEFCSWKEEEMQIGISPKNNQVCVRIKYVWDTADGL